MPDNRITALLIPFLLLTLSACATLPGGRPVPESEAAGVRAQFYEMQSRQQRAGGLDADVTVTFYGLFTSGSINGYLLTFPPAWLRFEAVNPLGLTESILTTDGRRFSYLQIRRQLAYSGWLDGHKAAEYVTAEQAQSITSWLLGRLPADIRVIDQVERDRNGDYWLTLAADSTDYGMVLYSRRQNRIKRYVTGDGRHRLDVSYIYASTADTRPPPATMPVPSLVTIRLGGHQAMSLAIRDSYPLSRLSKKQFTTHIPATFERIDLP